METQKFEEQEDGEEMPKREISISDFNHIRGNEEDIEKGKALIRQMIDAMPEQSKQIAQGFLDPYLQSTQQEHDEAVALLGYMSERWQEPMQLDAVARTWANPHNLANKFTNILATIPLLEEGDVKKNMQAYALAAIYLFDADHAAKLDYDWNEAKRKEAAMEQQPMPEQPPEADANS